MVEMMNTAADDLVGFRAHGTVDDTDVSQVVAALRVALERSDEVSMVADLSAFDDMTVRGMLRDLRAGLEHLSDLDRIERVAVVGAEGWMASAAKAEDWIPGIDVQLFDAGDSDEARAWAQA